MIRILLPAGLAALLFALAASNPGESSHTTALVEHIRHNCGDRQLVKGLCGGLASVAADVALRYEDHLFYSTARLGDMESLGFLGRVTVVSE